MRRWGYFVVDLGAEIRAEPVGGTIGVPALQSHLGNRS
jgi:hypothetical protein